MEARYPVKVTPSLSSAPSPRSSYFAGRPSGDTSKSPPCLSKVRRDKDGAPSGRRLWERLGGTASLLQLDHDRIHRFVPGILREVGVGGFVLRLSPNPPWVQSNQNPGISPNPGIPGQNGSLPDDHLPGTFGSSKAEATFTATQYYRYSCTCNNSSNVNLAGPISITRSVSQNPNGTWKYTITKSGVSASINPLP